MIRILSPSDGTVVSVLTQEQKNFIEDAVKRENAQATDFDYLNLVVEGVDRTQPEPVEIRWEYDTDHSQYLLCIGEDPELTDCRKITTTQTNALVYNLLLGRKYYFQVRADETVSPIYSFTLEDRPPRFIHIPGLVNVRDVGGWTTRDGKRIRQGLLYRGCKMERTKSGNPPIITDDGRRIMANELNIKTDIDLRADSVEKYDRSDLFEYGVEYKILPCRSYEEFFMDDCADGNRAIFEALADETIYPTYIHCWGGADRTSMIVFMLGSILGMREEDMLLDFELTSLAIWGVRSRNGDYIDNFKNSLAEYGNGQWYENAIAYLHSIGVTDAMMQRIRKIFLED